jgi:plasmid maintenance system antidote protein VapI
MTGQLNGQDGIPPVTDILDIAVRAYGIPVGKKEIFWEFPSRGPSHWSLVFDTETTTDEVQRLRIGCYQLRYGDELREAGLFHNPDAMTSVDRKVLDGYAARHGLKLITLREFVETVFIPAAHYWKATIIGFNLPFDLSRFAEDHSAARGKMRPGLSFSLRPKGQHGPNIRIKHLVKHVSLMELSGAGQRLPRGQRKRKIDVPQRRTAFIDVGTLAGALLSRPFTLRSLAEYLKTPHQKLGTDEHGKALSPEYLDYAVRDVQVTWECFVELRRRYGEHGLIKTPVRRILSEASLGKAYLREMGIRPFLKKQPDFPPALTGKIMGTYYGGRTEVHQRRLVMRVLYCDFTSMYPTVSALMKLWPFLIAKNITWRDATTETQEFLDKVTLEDLRRPETWPLLRVLVRIKPDGAVLPIRAKYELEGAEHVRRERHYTIGLNHLRADQPFWYTLADVIASKLLTGRAPQILEALAFEAGAPQDGLKPVAIAGKPEFLVDPLKEDFFKRIIELRMRTKGPERNALKLVANATGYGIFVQLDVNEHSKPVAIRCHPSSGREFLTDMDKVEEPGEFFHPLLGTLITGAARLMLAITERLINDAAITWTFCDTDSMAIAQPEGMSDAEFVRKAEAARAWFKPLNPYAVDVDLFKLEDANFAIRDGKRTDKLEALHCLAISSKRYVLFNIDAQGRPIIRKASGHGLGHLVAPYGEEDAPADIPAPIVSLDEIGVNRWQYDFWYCIALAALEGHPNTPDFSKLPNFDMPAVCKCAITTANIAGWFDGYNEGKSYAAQVRPFNFLLKFLPDPMADWESWREVNGFRSGNPDPPCVIAPYTANIAEAAANAFDRDTGAPVPTSMLKTYRQALVAYHRSPEAKFLDAGYLDSGLVRRRHVKAAAIVNIGKEAHCWEEQSYLGIDPDAEIAYGAGPQNGKERLALVKQAVAKFGPSATERAAKVSRQHLHSILNGRAAPSIDVLNRLARAAETLELAGEYRAIESEAILASVTERCGYVRQRRFAKAADITPGQLSRMLQRERPITRAMLTKLKQGLAETTQKKTRRKA